MKSAIKVSATALLVILLASANALAFDGRAYTDWGAGYKTGDFGTETRTSLYYASVGTGYVAPSWNAGLTIPYQLVVEDSSVMSANAGVGDLIAFAGGRALSEGASPIGLDASFSLKIPTADEADGMGTGEFDIGGLISISRTTGPVKTSLYSGYILIGDTPDTDYDNIMLFTLALSRSFGSTNAYVSYSWRNASISSSEDPQEAGVGIFHVKSRKTAYRGSAFYGFTDGGPDFGFTAGIVRWLGQG